MTSSETCAALGQDNNKRNVVCIGPAGENRVRFAAIMNDVARSAARGGPGAVMGSKNLKAIVIEGNEKVDFEDKERFRFVQYEATKMLKANPITSQALPEFGTAVMMNILNAVGALPTRNFSAEPLRARRGYQRRNADGKIPGREPLLLGLSHRLHARDQNLP